jgi:IS5 family transposase
MLATNIIPVQPQLPQVLPTIAGNVDYRDFRDQLLFIDHLLLTSGLESQLIQRDLQHWIGRCKRVGAKAQRTRQTQNRRALRCNIVRILLQYDFRELAVRIADSPLLQYFCGLSQIDCITVPSKSTLQRYDKWWPEGEVRQALQQLLQRGANAPEKVYLPEPVALDTAFVDSTCLPANIHYPVDWVLLRDATCTLMKSVQLIRKRGLKHRMEPPESFITRINTLCIAMTHAGRKGIKAAESQRQRKKILRQMDRLVGTVRQHAKRYRELLDQCWQQTNWTRPQAEQVLRRMDQVLEQLPKARQQARQRILQGEPVPNKEKILSLYEADVHVIVRRKAGAEVEFGNTFFLAENPQGLILDWELFRETAPSDSDLLPRTVGRMERAYGRKVRAIAGDRGFDSQANQLGLAEEGIYNAVCPRDPKKLRQRNGSWKFKRLQHRRSQTEGRIGILKNAFGAGAMRSKGFAHRELTLTWTVLVHDLWILARLQLKAARQAERKAA